MYIYSHMHIHVYIYIYIYICIDRRFTLPSCTGAALGLTRGLGAARVNLVKQIRVNPTLRYTYIYIAIYT